MLNSKYQYSTFIYCIMNISGRLIILNVLLILLSLLTSCDKEEDDFTSGSFYPNLPEKEDGESVDTTIIVVDTTVIDPPMICWEDPISVTRDSQFIDLFTKYGGGWTGGDATYSVALPDGRTVWFFGDTFLGTVNPDRSRTPTGLLRNTFVIQDGNDLTTLTSGSSTNQTTFLEPAEPGWWYWPGDGTVVNDTLQVIMFGFSSSGSGDMWDFGYKSIDLAKFTLPDISLVSIERIISEPTTNYGACLMEADDGYIYLYGAEKVGFNKHLHVARALDGDLSNKWTYYTGSGWSDNPEESIRMLPSVSEQFSVFEKGGQFYLMTQHHILGKEIYMYKSSSPFGPFENQTTIYCTPETGGDIFTYNAFAHPQFSMDDGLLISYNVNSFKFVDLFQNADNYRPYFFRVEGWE